MNLPGISGLIRATHGNEYTSPKTVLAFYAGLLALLEVGVAVVLAFLVSQKDLHYLVPWVIAFGGVIFVAIIAAVVAMNVIDPTKLQLGQMSGREFIDYQRVTRGDSIGGEYVETPSAGREATVEGKVLPSAPPDEDEAMSNTSPPEEL